MLRLRNSLKTFLKMELLCTDPILRTLALELSALGSAEQLRQVVSMALIFGRESGRRTDSGAILLANVTAAQLPPLPEATSTPPPRQTSRSAAAARSVVDDAAPWPAHATATLRRVAHAHALRKHGPAVEVEVATADPRRRFSPKDAGLTLCAEPGVAHGRAVQISELVQLPESGEEQSVVFVVPADEFEALRVAEAGEEWRLWVVEGQCSRVQARGDAGRGSGAGTWSLAVAAA